MIPHALLFVCVGWPLFPAATRVKGVDPSDLGPVLAREEILDRMDAHTKDCSACGKAYRGGASLPSFIPSLLPFCLFVLCPPRQRTPLLL